MVSQIQPPKTQMNPTLASLIQDSLTAEKELALYIAELAAVDWKANPDALRILQDRRQLAENALNEHVSELIDTRIAQMLKELRP